jgi:hypothetical protein
MQSLVIQLPNRFDSFHESGEFLELGPLIVNRGNGCFHLNRFFDMIHKKFSFEKNSLRKNGVSMAAPPHHGISFELARRMGDHCLKPES